MMAELFLRTVSAAVMVSALLLPLLLGRGWLESRYAAQTRWLLWLGVAVVLLVTPLLPRSMAPVQVEVPARAVAFTQAGPVAVPGASETDQIVAPAAPAQQTGFSSNIPDVTVPAPVSYRPVDWTQLAAALWLAVAALLLAVQAVRYHLTRHRLLRASHLLERREEVELRVLPGLKSPVTMGFLHPVVFLPSAGTAPMALRHELTHVKRRDIWGKGLLFLACALYWFHPLVWLMARQADRDMEAACDGQLAKDLAPGERKAYGVLLLSAAGGGGSVPFATRFGGSKEQMKARLTQLFRPGKSSRALVCAVLALAVVLGSLVACRDEAAEDEQLADGVYCAAFSDVSYPVGEDDAEGEDYGSIRLSLLAYDETEGPHGEPLGEFTLPLSAELTLRRSEGDEEEVAGEKGTEEWKRAVLNCIMWPMLRSMYIPDMDDYLTVEVQGGEVVHMSWVLVPNSTCYVNTANGFTLALPDSWAGKYEVEDSGTIVTFYQKDADRAAGHLMDLVITPREDFWELYADKDLEGIYQSGGPWIKVLYEGDNVVYAQMDPASFPEAPRDALEEERLSLLQDAIAALGPENFFLYGGGTLAEDQTHVPIEDEPAAPTEEPSSDYDKRIKCVTIEGFELGTPFEDLPQSFRDTLTKEGAEDLTGEGTGIWTTYTAPGIEVVTTQINPDWEGLSESEREKHEGKEFLASVRVTDSAYATQAGLKVGDSVERCSELGYDEMWVIDCHYRVGLQSLTLTVEDGVITGMESFDGARYVGNIFY